MTIEPKQIRAGRTSSGAVYDLYTPSTYDGQRALRLIVSVTPVHPSIPIYRPLELFGGFATAHQCLVLAPRFDFGSGFQTLGIGRGVRHDLLLLDMVDDVARSLRVGMQPFHLFGYSAGGQFAHRFMYLHRARLGAVAIGAPGTVTLPSLGYPWPGGLADVRHVTGQECDLADPRWPRILLFVGDQDVTLEDVNQSDEANRFGRTRLERGRTLHKALQTASIAHEYAEIPGLAHDDLVTQDWPMETVWQFFAGVI